MRAAESKGDLPGLKERSEQSPAHLPLTTSGIRVAISPAAIITHPSYGLLLPSMHVASVFLRIMLLESNSCSTY